jgi:5-methylcytosine-specific restriction enzyme subunit McrC
MTIPVRNLYYLFAYAWARFPAGDEVSTGVDDCPDLPNLLARLLIDGIHRLMRRGLDRGYISIQEDSRAPRGRMHLNEIVKRQTLRTGHVVCTYDELLPDVLHNCILKSTVKLLAGSDRIEPSYKHELLLIHRRLEAVSDLRLDAGCFKRVQLSRNTRQYGLLLQICELVFHSLLPDEQGTGSRFADILDDELRMSAIFEEFLRNFYAYEQDAFSIGREVMPWAAEALTAGALSFLPAMQTDITLRSGNRVIVAEAKFYKETLKSFRGASKLNSGNLYQLYAYLKHTSAKYPASITDGVLIYPTVNQQLFLDYQLPGHRVRVATVDLARPWREIHDYLLDILFKPYGDDTTALAA